MSNVDLARMYEVSGSCIGRIVNGHSWKIKRKKTRETLEKRCEFCNAPFSNRSKQGIRVGPQRFNAARFCGIECSRKSLIKKVVVK